MQVPVTMEHIEMTRGSGDMVHSCPRKACRYIKYRRKVEKREGQKANDDNEKRVSLKHSEKKGKKE